MVCWSKGVLEYWGSKTHYSIIPSLQYSSLRYSIGLTVIMLVVPACWSGSPAVMATKSPRFTNPNFNAFFWASRNIASVL